MPVFKRSVTTPCTAEQAFAFVSDFRHSAKWDPQVVRAEKLTPGAIGLGTQYLLQNRFPIPDLPYEVVEFEAPYRVTLQGKTAGLEYRDSIRFEPQRTGSILTYHAVLNFRGLLGIGNPLLGVVFQRVGSSALDGISRALADLSAAGSPAPLTLASASG